MACSHDGFHTIRTSYDIRGGLLHFHWICEGCGARLSEARRERYRPSFDPRGHETFPNTEPFAGDRPTVPVPHSSPDRPATRL
jgi:hypothetical protein